MNTPSALRAAAFLVCVLAATSGFSQDLPAIPPSYDPTFWGHANKPYVLKLTVTNTSVTGNNTGQTSVSEENVSRDSVGRVRTESFYYSGQPMGITIRDPGKNTFTMMQVVTKRVWVLPAPRFTVSPRVKVWTVERLPSRVIEGFPAEGFRFTRTVPASDDGKRAVDRLIEEDWISNELDLVLERKYQSQLTGTRTETVSHINQVEPDSTLFAIPSDYSLQQSGQSVSP